MKKFIYTVFFLTSCMTSLGASSPYAIIGGYQGQFRSATMYSALVDMEGNTKAIEGPARPQGPGLINSAAISSSGVAIIGGAKNDNSFLALIDSNGFATSIHGPGYLQSNGSIGSVAMNYFGNSIVGGAQNGNMYAALVNSNGYATSINGAARPQNEGSIFSVAINRSGFGIIGGQQGTFPNLNMYAALINSNGHATSITGAASPQGVGAIYGVAINNSNLAIIGGQEGSFPNLTKYAALVSSDGTSIPLKGKARPTGLGSIYSTGINNSGTSIIGGFDGEFTSPKKYAILADPQGNSTSLKGLESPTDEGTIIVVGINDFGEGIIGGNSLVQGLSHQYAALFSQDGTTRPLSGPAFSGAPGYIYSAAINPSGSAIIGGVINGNTSEQYAALVAPDGTTSFIRGADAPQGEGYINVGIIQDLIDPTVFGPSSFSFADLIFALSTSIIPNHLMNEQLYKVHFDHLPVNPFTTFNYEGLSASLKPHGKQKKVKKNQRNTAPLFSLWTAPLGFNSCFKNSGSLPKVTSWCVGNNIGFDYLGWEQMIFGGGFAYAYQWAFLSNDLGHANTNQEILTLYYQGLLGKISLNTSVIGGVFQTRNKRNIIGGHSAKSKIYGGLFCPHFKVGIPICFEVENKPILEPFIMVDWANYFQRCVRESSETSLSLMIKPQHASILRTEIGTYFFTSWQIKQKCFLNLNLGLSYVNQVPFNPKNVSVFYVGAISSFPVQLFNNRVQNLGCVRASFGYKPLKARASFFNLNYQGELGVLQFSQNFSFEFGYEF